jgi:hypothetical protein
VRDTGVKIYDEAFSLLLRGFKTDSGLWLPFEFEGFIVGDFSESMCRSLYIGYLNLVKATKFHWSPKSYKNAIVSLRASIFLLLKFSVPVSVVIMLHGEGKTGPTACLSALATTQYTVEGGKRWIPDGFETTPEGVDRETFYHNYVMRAISGSLTEASPVQYIENIRVLRASIAATSKLDVPLLIVMALYDKGKTDVSACLSTLATSRYTLDTATWYPDGFEVVDDIEEKEGLYAGYMQSQYVQIMKRLQDKSIIHGSH